MASFTDQGIQFNPYIQQIPVDEYTRAGMLRQQRYDEGVQRIQNYIDTVGGLPVAGDANKAVLTEKMGKLRTALQGTIGADFGKMNLQMQIGNLAAQIAKDPVIQTSVEAARRIQALEASIAEAKKSGKGYSAANEAYVRDYVNQYMAASNKEAGLAYNGPTSMHSVTTEDVHKKIRETIAPLKGMEDIDYNITPDGNVMLINEDKILDGTRIKAAIESVLTADDRKALSIDGWYNTYSLTDEELVNKAGKAYTEIANNATRMADYYENYALLTPNMSESDKARYKDIASQHKAYAEQYTKAANSIKESYGTSSFNRESIAGDLTREMMEASYAGMYQFRQQKKDVKISPYFEAAVKEEELMLKKYEAQTARIKAENEAKENSLIGTIDPTVTINVDPNDSKFSNIYNTSATKEKIESNLEYVQDGGEGQEAVLKSVAKALMDDNNPDAQNMSGLVRDTSSPDGVRWKSKEDRERIKKIADEAVLNYKKASLDPNFKGTIPLSSVPLRNAHLNNIIKATVADKLTESDRQITQDAVRKNPWLKASNPYEKVSFKTKDGGTYNTTVGELVTLVHGSMEERAITTANPGGSTLAATKGKFLKKGSKLETFLREKLGTEEYAGSEVQKVMTKYGISESNITSAKDAIYKTKNEIVNPKMRMLAVSDKQMTLDEYNVYRSAVLDSDIFNNGVSVDGETIDASMKPLNAKDITIRGAYRDIDGRVKMRASWQYGSGKDTKVVEADVDVDEFRNSLGNSRPTWLYSRFFSDRNPELTDALRRPGASPNTNFSEKNGFAGSLYVTGNNKVARNYMIRYDKNSGNYHAIIAIPKKEGGFQHIDLNPSGYPHAGAAMDGVEFHYGLVTDSNPVDKMDEELIKRQLK